MLKQDRVREATAVSLPAATITVRRENGHGYLRVSNPLPGGGANQHSALSVAAGAHVTGIDFHTNDDPAVFSRFDQFEPQ